MFNKLFNILFFAIIIGPHVTTDSEDLSRFKGRSESRVESRVQNVDSDTTPVVEFISFKQH